MIQYLIIGTTIALPIGVVIYIALDIMGLDDEPDDDDPLGGYVPPDPPPTLPSGGSVPDSGSTWFLEDDGSTDDAVSNLILDEPELVLE